MRIEVVRNVEVEPRFKILYVGSAAQQSPMAYKIKVLEGSGHFSVSLNDTTKAELVHKDRELFIYPRAVGGLSVHVEDLEVPESRIAVSEILISDIARLTLQSNTTLIEEGDSLNLLVTAFASNG